MSTSYQKPTPKNSPIFDPLRTEAKHLQAWLRNGSLRSVDLIESYIAQIQKHNDYLHAMISIVPKDLLMERARLLDNERTNNKLRSPIHGIPVILKDNIATHPSLGVKTTAGSLALAESKVKRNARIVDMLIADGAIILGKANLSEMSNYKGINITSGWSAVGGQTQSAYTYGDVDPDDGRDGHSNPSGSSSGPAVAASAGFAPFTIGTETDGSLIVPACRAALYTIKPSIGLIPQDGIVPVSHTMDSAGPMAKTAYDLALLLDHLVDPVSNAVQESFTTAVTGSWEGIGVATLDPKVWKFPAEYMKPVEEATIQINHEIEAAYSKLSVLAKPYAHHVHAVDLDLFELNGKNSEAIILNADFAKDINAYLEDLEVSPVRTLKELIDFNIDHTNVELPPEAPNQDHMLEAYDQNTSPEEYRQQLAHLRHVTKDLALDRIFSEYGVNIVVAPADSLFTCLAAGSAYPVASLPLSYLKYNGRPFGLAAIAPAKQERLLIQLQSAWEATFGGHKPPPQLEEQWLVE